MVSRFPTEWLIILCLLLGIDQVCGQEALKPGIPSADSVRFWNIPPALEALDQEAERLSHQLEELPSLEDSLQIDAYGYHSSYLPKLERMPREPRWTVTMEIPYQGGVQEIYLVPAADRREPNMPGYGFPKRFQIKGVDFDGEEHLLVDYQQSDFPDPGRLPVRLLLETRRYQNVSLQVFRGQVEDNKEFFALDEIALRASFYLWSLQKVDTTGSFEAPPFWSSDYLIDQKTSMGLPVQPHPDGRQYDQDFVKRFDGETSEPVVIELDLGENKRHGELVLYPAQPPEGVFVPGYGFPGKLQVEISRYVEETGERELFYQEEPQILQNPGNNIVRFLLSGREGRWLTITFEDFPVYQGASTFGFGEIELTEARESMSRGANVSSPSLPDSDTEALQRLTDGLSGGRTVIPLLPWLDELSARRDLQGELDRIEQMKADLFGRWNQGIELSLSIALWGGSTTLIVVVAVGAIVQRRRFASLRRSIAKDLHDEVGSNLGSVRLVAERLQLDSGGPEAQRDLSDLVLMAREASASLMDVVWMTDKRSLKLSELIPNFKKRAERVLSGIDVEVEIDVEPPDLEVPLTVRRQLMLFFKEAVYNCARHSGAKKVRLEIVLSGSAFRILLTDDGCGFDTESLGDGWGIDSMRERVEELQGTFILNTAVGKGTAVGFSIPLKGLLRIYRTGYQSSN
ncbi:ATP-binding protein [Pelagicoccus sp. SDUM812002]|uniref:sensor histidine kinase n=1 Tax=Pelagicoccus sp. SDUM812002 TaxID=3041266 RepID=UPI00281046ED|nr:ATP-binding protein [Pelagicoccus sp. SDUM812002]MDQ8188366.1 histidine kinase [Pelagicoccus sp. SDUM812002]